MPFYGGGEPGKHSAHGWSEELAKAIRGRWPQMLDGPIAHVGLIDGWHVFACPRDNTFPEAREWAIDQFGVPLWNCWRWKKQWDLPHSTPFHYSIEFKDEGEAMLFKMRWC